MQLLVFEEQEYYATLKALYPAFQSSQQRSNELNDVILFVRLK